eukprot:3823602-Prymnesium_polylepis.1
MHQIAFLGWRSRANSHPPYDLQSGGAFQVCSRLVGYQGLKRQAVSKPPGELPQLPQDSARFFRLVVQYSTPFRYASP